MLNVKRNYIRIIKCKNKYLNFKFGNKILFLIYSFRLNILS